MHLGTISEVYRVEEMRKCTHSLLPSRTGSSAEARGLAASLRCLPSTVRRLVTAEMSRVRFMRRAQSSLLRMRQWMLFSSPTSRLASC